MLVALNSRTCGGTRGAVHCLHREDGPAVRIVHGDTSLPPEYWSVGEELTRGSSLPGLDRRQEGGEGTLRHRLGKAVDQTIYEERICKERTN